MASADFDSFGNAPYLSSNEQNLLLNALKSNKAGDNAGPSDATLNPDVTQLAPDSAFFDSSLLENDFPNDFSWDLDADTLQGLRNDNGPLSSNSADGDDSSPLSQDGKRKEHPDDEDDDDSSPGKRRESDGKVAKKPGRKPLTSEPTSKRKAQNRAAQRAFRERKEKHLRDLETKVEDLEKASEATNHENGILRAQVDKLQAELSEYRKRIGSTTSPAGYSPNSAPNRMNWDLNSSFNFEFPTFGGIEANDQSKTAAKAKECVNSLQALRALDDLERSSAEQDFYRTASTTLNSPSPLSAARTMSMSTSNAGSNYASLSKTGRSPTNSTDKSGSNSASPASLGLGSSCVTTPEASADSPQNKNDYSSFDARGSPNQPKTPGLDNVPNLDWFGNQSNAAFDPILFGDFEETQKSILNNADLGINNFDTFPWNLDSTTSGMWASPEPIQAAVQSAVPQKKSSLMDRVEQAAQGRNHDDPLALPKAPEGHNQLTCAKLWDRVQRSEKVLSGEADMDDLCSQLKAKAKCGGPNKGAVVDEKDVDAILGPDPQKKKPAGMWNMFS